MELTGLCTYKQVFTDLDWHLNTKIGVLLIKYYITKSFTMLPHV